MMIIMFSSTVTGLNIQLEIRAIVGHAALLILMMVVPIAGVMYFHQTNIPVGNIFVYKVYLSHVTRGRWGRFFLVLQPRNPIFQTVRIVVMMQLTAPLLLGESKSADVIRGRKI